ncbi:MAG: Gldg family protein [Bdellovibrionales bacterium]|nr:Gldg family protein [Bdellovibrionales bacterium]
MHKSILSASGIAILGVILLLTNGISNSLFSRFYVDLTEERLYSLSDGSKNILAKIEEPVTLRYYFSKTDGASYPAIKLYGQRVLDLLREYDRLGGDNVTLEVYDPRPDSEEEEWAQKYGLNPFTLPTGEKLFFGLAAVNAYGDEDSIPVFNLQRQQFLEYDITKLIHSLRTGALPKVGIITTLDIQGAPKQMPPGMPPQPSDAWILVNQLENVADVEFLGTDVEKIPDDVKVLMVIFPQNLAEKTRYAIDQYAVKGGSLFIAVDPFCSAFEPPQDPNNPFASIGADRSAVLPELSGWGVEMKGKKVVGDINLATPVAVRQGQRPEMFPVWLTFSSANAPKGEWVVNQDEIISSDLETLMIPWPGAFDIKKQEGVTITPLLRTTDEAMLYEENDIRFSADRPEVLRKKYVRGTESQVVALKIQGKLKSNFSAKPGDGAAETNMSTEGGHISQGTEDANIIVVADVDFLSDAYAAQAQNIFGARFISLLNDNLIFAANATENLSGSNDLISLRSRGRFVRPFTKVQEIEASAQDRWKQEEEEFQAKLNEANQRLSQLQNGMDSGGGKQAFSSALLEEMKDLRERKKDAQQKLRDVRRKLREDKEDLGRVLFLVNTFLIPVILVLISVFWYRKKRGGNVKEDSNE